MPAYLLPNTVPEAFGTCILLPISGKCFLFLKHGYANSMENIIANLNKLFDSRIRLGIMSILSVNDSIDFSTMKELLELTDGNLASHLKALEGAGYIQTTKQFIGRKPNTKYQITELGKRDFREHLDALEKLIR